MKDTHTHHSYEKKKFYPYKLVLKNKNELKKLNYIVISKTKMYKLEFQGLND